MSDEPSARVVPLRPDRASVHATIRRIATEDRRVYLSEHAKERMEQRAITRIDLIRVLTRGHIEGDIIPGNRAGEWKCKVVANVKGSREIGVVTLLINNDRLLIKTTEWEDL